MRKVDRRVKHGHSGNGTARTSEYRTWEGMRARCTNPLACGYPKYGGRGIRVCERWATSFSAFLADMGPKPTSVKGRRVWSIDRIDNSGDYEPGNCRWATAVEQNNNRGSFNKTLTVYGVTMGVSAWAKAVGLKAPALFSRIKHGWSPERAVGLYVAGI